MLLITQGSHTCRRSTCVGTVSSIQMTSDSEASNHDNDSLILNSICMFVTCMCTAYFTKECNKGCITSTYCSAASVCGMATVDDGHS